MKVQPSSSACAAVQPPRSNPPRRSSSGPPGPWYTPSRVTIIDAVSFMVIAPSHRGQLPRAAIALIAEPYARTAWLGRTPLPDRNRGNGRVDVGEQQLVTERGGFRPRLP